MNDGLSTFSKIITLHAGSRVPGEWLGAVVVRVANGDPWGDEEIVRVPVYLHVVRREREIVTRAAATLGPKEHAPGTNDFEVRSIHWFPYDRVGEVDADP